MSVQHSIKCSIEARMVFKLGIEINVLLEVGEITIEDVGIGSYECHGYKGCDTQMALTEAQCDSIKVWSDRRNTYVEPSLRLKEFIEEELFEYPEIVETLEKFAGEWEEDRRCQQADFEYEVLREERAGL